MRKDSFKCNFYTTLKNLNDLPSDILTAQDLADIGLVSDKSRCYQLVQLGRIPVYERSRKRLWFHRENVIDYIEEAIRKSGYE